MTRAEFLRQLKAGLSGLPETIVEGLLSDYACHFEQAASEGRDESEIAVLLGDPKCLARDIRADAVLSTWEEAPRIGRAFPTIAVAAGLLATDAVLLIPALVVAISVLAVLAFAGLLALFAGVGLIVFAVWNGLGGSMLAALLSGVGLVAGAVAIGGLSVIASKQLIDGLVWFARQHRRALDRLVRP